MLCSRTALRTREGKCKIHIMCAVGKCGSFPSPRHTVRRRDCSHRLGAIEVGLDGGDWRLRERGRAGNKPWQGRLRCKYVPENQQLDDLVSSRPRSSGFQPCSDSRGGQGQLKLEQAVSMCTHCNRINMRTKNLHNQYLGRAAGGG